MEKRTKNMILVVSHVAVLAGGFLWGSKVLQSTVLPAEAMLLDGMFITRYAANVEFQRDNGTEDDYRAALEMFLKALEKVDYEKDPILDKNIYFTDRALTYMRLSVLESRLGNEVREEENLKSAVDSCAPLNREWCNSARLRELVAKMDNQSSNKSLNQIGANSAPTD